jgi:hypothetical protein
VISSRRFPPPWTLEETDACFIVQRAGARLSITFAVALQQKLLKQTLSLFEIARVERGDVFPKNEPRPGIRAVEAKDQIPGVRAGRHENPRRCHPMLDSAWRVHRREFRSTGYHPP